VCETLDVSVTETIGQMFDACMKRFAPTLTSATTHPETERKTTPLPDVSLLTAGHKRSYRHLSENPPTAKRTTTEANAPLITNGNDNIADIALPPGNIKDLSTGFQAWFCRLTNGFKVEREEIDHAKAKCDELMEQLEVQRIALHAKEARISQWISTERQTGELLNITFGMNDIAPPCYKYFFMQKRLH
jgi:hypothetical protein